MFVTKRPPSSTLPVVLGRRPSSSTRVPASVIRAVYVADTRRCAFNICPVETGMCNAVNVNSRIYAIWNDEPSRRRAARH
jgi:hypothetical protein